MCIRDSSITYYSEACYDEGVVAHLIGHTVSDRRGSSADKPPNHGIEARATERSERCRFLYGQKRLVIMMQGRGRRATEAVFCLKGTKSAS